MAGLFDEMFQDDEREQSRQKFYGITTGVVKENWNDKFPGMIKVELNLGEKGKCVTDWVRFASPYAGATYGQYMLPEVGDEVLIGFHLGNTNRPIVMGSLWNQEKKFASESATEKNTVKKIMTKGGHEIIFEEEADKERIEIHTPKNLKITLEDETQLISITDENGDNIVSIDSKNGAITLKAAKKISLDAGGKAKLTLDGTGNAATLEAGNVTLKAQQKLAAEGSMVELKANSTFQAEGSAGMVLKGATVKIN